MKIPVYRSTPMAPPVWKSKGGLNYRSASWWWVNLMRVYEPIWK